MPECQSVRMSKIINDDLTRGLAQGAPCCTHVATVGVKANIILDSIFGQSVPVFLSNERIFSYVKSPLWQRQRLPLRG